MGTYTTYRPHKKKRKRKLGFLVRMRTVGGRNIINRRRKKGRKKAVCLKGKKVFCSITKRGDFKKVFELGSKFPSKFFIIYALPNELPYCRLGLAVSRKVGMQLFETGLNAVCGKYSGIN